MKIKIISTGSIVDYPATYAVRMIEQGQAIKASVKAAQKKEAPLDAADEPDRKGKK